MSTLVAKAPGYTAHIVTARRDHGCDDYPRCAEGIKASERYLSCTTFPGHDSGYADAAGHPVRWRYCERSSHFQRATTVSS